MRMSNKLIAVSLATFSCTFCARSEMSREEIIARREAKMRALRDAAMNIPVLTREEREKRWKDRMANIANATDAEVKSAFLAATTPMCDLEEKERLYDYAEALCGGDDRRYSRIAEEIAKERPDRTPWAILVLGGHGSVENLPFLYGFTNDVIYAAMSASSIVSIAGVTSNSIALVDHVMRLHIKNEHDKYYLCSRLSKKAKTDEASPETVKLVVSALRRYAREVPSVAQHADKFLLELDRSYEKSAARIDALKAILARNEKNGNTSYAEEELNKICKEQK